MISEDTFKTIALSYRMGKEVYNRFFNKCVNPFGGTFVVNIVVATKEENVEERSSRLGNGNGSFITALEPLKESIFLFDNYTNFFFYLKIKTSSKTNRAIF